MQHVVLKLILWTPKYSTVNHIKANKDIHVPVPTCVCQQLPGNTVTDEYISASMLTDYKIPRTPTCIQKSPRPVIISTAFNKHSNCLNQFFQSRSLGWII